MKQFVPEPVGSRLYYNGRFWTVAATSRRALLLTRVPLVGPPDFVLHAIRRRALNLALKQGRACHLFHPPSGSADPVPFPEPGPDRPPRTPAAIALTAG